MKKKKTQSEKPLVDGMYLLEKFQMKGGWTYAEIPEVLQNKQNPFGWVRVRGSIDSYELKQYKLMPMGNGKLFLPVKAEIRKKINKQAGDEVRIILFQDETPTEIPEELIDCFSHEDPKLFNTFQHFSEGEQKTWIDWIYDAKTEDTKAKRILVLMQSLEKGLKFQDKAVQS